MPIENRNLQQPADHATEVIAYPMPLRPQHATVIYAAPGQTIEQILDQSGLVYPDIYEMHVRIDNTIVDRDLWSRVRPKPGHQVIVQIVPLGGGGGHGKSAVMFVTAILLVAAVWLIPGICAFRCASMLAVAKGLVIGAALNEINTLLTPAPPKLAKLSGTDNATTSPTLFISGAQNTANKFGVIPMVFGRNRVTPYYGAEPYSETVGDNQFLRLLFVLGMGPLSIEDLRIGETPISSYEGVDVEIFNGLPGDGPGTLYTNDVASTNFSIIVKHVDPPAKVTTEAGANEIFLDIVFGQGIYHRDKKGELSEGSVHIKIEIALFNTGLYVTRFDGTLTFTKPDPFPYSFRFEGFDGGQYDLRVTRVSPDRPPADPGEGFNQDEFSISTLRIVTYTPPIAVGAPPLAKVALRIKATGQLNGVVNTFNCIATSLADTTVAEDVSLTAGAKATCNRTCSIENNAVRTYEIKAKATTSGYFGGGIFQAGNPARGQATKRDFSLIFANPSDLLGATAMQLKIASGFDITFDCPEAYDGEWHHYAVVYDGATVKIYVDGALNTSTALTALTTNLVAVKLGAWNDGANEHWFDGQLRDFRIWTVARSADEIADNIDTVFVSTQSGLRTQLLFTEGSGPTLSGLNGYAFTLTGSYSWIAAADREADEETALRPTRNPADMLMITLQGAGNRDPWPDDEIDLTQINTTWRDHCTAKGFLCDFVQDTDTTFPELVRAICQTGAAQDTISDNGFSVFIDMVSVSRGLLAPPNCRNFRSERTYIEQPDALRVRFLDSTNNFTQGERIVYGDNYGVDPVVQHTKDTAQVYTEYEFPGITTPDLNYVFGRRRLAELRLRPETYSLEVDVVGVRFMRGNRVKVAYDTIVVGSAYGRIKDIARNASNEAIAIEVTVGGGYDPAKDYAVQMQLADGSVLNANINNPAEDQQTLTFVDPVSSTLTAKMGNDYAVVIGERDRVSIDCVMKAIQAQPGLKFTFTLVDYNEAIFVADEETIPEYDPQITLPVESRRIPPAPIILGIVTDESVLARGIDGVLIVRAAISFLFVNGMATPIDAIQVQFRLSYAEGGWDALPTIPYQTTRVYASGVQQGKLYDFRIRVISTTGEPSPWTEQDGVLVIGMGTPPPPPQFFDMTVLPNGLRSYEWILGDVPIDVVGVVIRYALGTGMEWDDMLPLHTSYLPASPYVTALPIPGGTYTFICRSIDVQGNLSLTGLTIVRTIPDLPLIDFLYWNDVKAHGWPDTKTGCAVNSDLNLEATDATIWDDLPIWDEWLTWPLNPNTLIYESAVIDLGSSLDVIGSSESSGNGSITIEMASSADNVTYSSWATPGSATARYFKFRATVTPNPPTQPLPLLTKLIFKIVED